MKRLPTRIASWFRGHWRADAHARARSDQASIANIDWNATATAAAVQSAADVSAAKAGSPADEGGEG
ncbi:MAG: hypothetical protein ACKVVT_03620 [Dehalococcoidia bacterium]